MVAIERETQPAEPVITGFSGTGFRVDDTVFDEGLWLAPGQATAWSPPALERLDLSSLEGLIDITPPPEFLLLGTGVSLRRPAPSFVSAIEQLDIGVEAMDSRAAARAWSVLRAEDRWIIAALFPLDGEAK